MICGSPIPVKDQCAGRCTALGGQLELFRVTERRQSNELMSHDFAWPNGPAGGTYGFTVAPSSTPGLDPLLE